MHQREPGETGKGPRTEDVPRSPLQSRSGTEAAGSRGMEMAEDSAALGGGGCSHMPCRDSLNHSSHGSLCIVTPKSLIIRADAKSILAGGAEKLSLGSVPWGGKNPQNMWNHHVIKRKPNCSEKEMPIKIPRLDPWCEVEEQTVLEDPTPPHSTPPPRRQQFCASACCQLFQGSSWLNMDTSFSSNW